MCMIMHNNVNLEGTENEKESFKCFIGGSMRIINGGMRI